MPITEQVYLAVHEGKPAREVLADLMGRQRRAEKD